MSSPAAARAEARRKAILSRGGDRLAKLTTSGRGKDAAAYMPDDPPLPKLSALDNFVDGPSPPQNNINNMLNSEPDPSVWSDEQQQRLMEALMMGQMPQARAGPAPTPGAKEATPPPGMPDFSGNPLLAQLMAAAGGDGGGTGFAPGPGMGMGMNSMMGGPGLGPQPTVARPKTLLQKLLPVVHVLAMWALVAYFAFFQEPKLYEALGGLADEKRDQVLVRWSAFIKEAARVQAVPFFWALTTVEVILHSTRLFTGLDNEPLPGLLSMATPFLPPNVAFMIVTGWKYIGLLFMLLNDIAAVLVGFGFLAWLGTWFAV